MTIILSNLNRFKNVFTGRFIGKLVVKWIFKKITMNLAHAATLLFETLMSAKEATNDKLQGIVLTIFKVSWGC